jgi:ketosteroid isomerase-like protein
MTTIEETLATIERFNEAFNTHDVDAVMSLMTDDVVFESTAAPDGRQVVGHEAMGAFWAEFFSSTPGAWFDTEDLFAAGDRCLVQWRFTFDKENPDRGHVRGVDVFRVRDGKVAEKFSYVKA